MPPADLVRKDPRFKELGLDPTAYTTKAAVVRLLLAHPELLQRPIAIKGSPKRGSVILARPKEKILDLL